MNLLEKIYKFSRPAFTMAEILLSLTIIGVVAAITLPSLTGNINERTWNTQRKALFSRLNQAVALMPQIRGYGNVTKSIETNTWGTDCAIFSSDIATEAFLTNGLGKVLKLNNICNHENLGDCGLPDTFTGMGSGSKLQLSDFKSIAGLNEKFNKEGASGCAVLLGAVRTKGAAFETANGESVLVHYNPICLPANHNDYGLDSYSFEPIGFICANFIYDLNGKKGPNTIGKDMGVMSLFYSSDSLLVAPNLYAKVAAKSVTLSEASQACRAYDDARIPTREEMAAVSINKKVFGTLDSNEMLWTSTRIGGQVFGLAPGNDTMYKCNVTDKLSARCVKRN